MMLQLIRTRLETLDMRVYTTELQIIVR